MIYLYMGFKVKKVMSKKDLILNRTKPNHYDIF